MAEETTLYDATGKPVAYIDHDNESTIYSFDGKPLAYIDTNGHVYGFNGKHLGWFQGNIIWDHDGNRAGFTKDTSPVYTQYEPYKGHKQYKPYKGYKEYAPFQPFKSSSTSKQPLIELLARGCE